ncbi:putative major facilitator superfamily transporter [Myriangium duriaei CBS 260.36]|uniref:Efflux pump dotC n=1 Tax=Myriangium duriaei CBS 260.36 TaxID=1168546 RepID=A0A9P4J019_9PEZI|nr:putative major facilitator superfamily transporter [Myriangium duriaei CBS 260.36]
MQQHQIPSDSSLSSPAEKESNAAAAAAAAPAPKQDLKDFEQEPASKRAIVMLALCMAVFLAALDVTIITTAIPTIVEQFKSPSGYTWIGSAFLLANAASVPTWGKVSEIFGRKPVLLTANVVFLVGSLVCALANSIGMLIAGRAVQGLGAGGLVILVNITIADLFSLRNRGAYYGIVGGVWAFSSAIGPIIGGAFTQRVSWRWCFYVNLPLDGAAFLIILFFLKLNTPKTPLWDGLKAIDWLGSLLVVGGTLMFLFGLTYGGDSHPWNSAIVLCLIIFGVVTWAIFLVVEWKVAKYPVIPISIFKTRSVAACYVCVFLHGFVFIASSYYLPLYFQACRNASPLISGVYLLPNCIALSIGSLGVGIFIRKTGRYIECMYLGFFFMTLGYGLLINLEANSSLAKVIIYQLIAGLGIGPLFQSPLIALQSHVKPRDIAPATATLGFIRQLSTSMSVVIGGVIYQNQMSTKKAQLVNALGPQVGQQLTGSGAGSSTQLVHTLPQPGKSVAEDAIADSLSKMWILYTVMAFIGLVVTPLIVVKKLSRDHTENKTGLEAEKEKAEERKREAAEKLARKNLKGNKGVAPSDSELEKGVTAPVKDPSGPGAAVSSDRSDQAAVKTGA